MQNCINIYLNGYFDALNNLKKRKNVTEAVYYKGKCSDEKNSFLKNLKLSGNIIGKIEKREIEKLYSIYLEKWLKKHLIENSDCLCDEKLIEYSIFKIIDYIDIFIFDNNDIFINLITEYKFFYEYTDSLVKKTYQMEVLQISLEDTHLFLINSIEF